MGLNVALPRHAPFTARLAVAGLNLGRLVAPALVAFWFFLFIFIGKPNSGADVYSATVTLHVLFAIPAVAYGGWLLLSRRLPGPTPLDWSALALIAAFALSVATSVNPRISLETSLLVGMAVLTFYMVHDVKSLSVQFWVRTLIVIAGVIAALGLLAVALQYVAWLERVLAVKGSLSASDYAPPLLFRVRGVLDHPNVYAMFLNLTLPFVAARALMCRGPERWSAITVLALGVLGVFFSGTRGAWLATAGWMCAFAVLVFVRHYDRRHLRDLIRFLRVQWVRWSLVGGGSIVCLAVAALLSTEARPDWLFRATLDDRAEALRTALAIFKDHWLTGAGPYTHMLLDDAYGVERGSREVPLVLVHAHNLYVQTLADLGVMGAALVLGGACLALPMFAVAWRTGDTRARLYVAAGAAATAGFLVHGVSEAPPSWNSVFVPFALILALVARQGAASPRFSFSWAGAVPRLCILALVPVALLAWWAMDVAQGHYDRSLAAWKEGNLPVAAVEAERATDADSSFFPYVLHSGVLQVRLYQQEPESDASSLEQGLAYLRRATELEPYSALAYANLALALQLRGDLGGAVAAARTALADDPGDEDVNVAAGTVLEAAGLQDEAVQAYARAVMLDPDLAHAPFWTTTPARWELRADAIARSGVDVCRLGKGAALYGQNLHELPGLADECAALVERSGDGGDAASLALILHRLGRHDEARARAQEAQALAPRDRDVLLSTAIVLAPTLTDMRYGLAKALTIYDRDATGLLLASYLPGVGEPAGISVAVPQESESIPSAFLQLKPGLNPDLRLSPGEEANPRSITYYRWGALRDPPPVTLIRGDWVMMVTPRTILASEIAEALYVPD